MGCYQRELQMPVWPDEVFPVPFQKSNSPWYSYIYLGKGTCCISPLLQLWTSCCFILTLNMTFWPELAFEGVGHPCIGKGMRKEEVSPCVSVYCIGHPQMHFAGFFFFQLLFRVSGMFLSLCYCSIYSLNLLICFSWTEMQLAETRREMYILLQVAVSLFLRSVLPVSI